VLLPFVDFGSCLATGVREWDEMTVDFWSKTADYEGFLDQASIYEVSAFERDLEKGYLRVLLCSRFRVLGVLGVLETTMTKMRQFHRRDRELGIVLSVVCLFKTNSANISQGVRSY